MFNKTYKNAGCSVYVYASLFLPVFTFTKADCTLLIISSIACKKWISESKRWCGSGLVYIFFTASTWLWFREFFVFDVHLCLHLPMVRNVSKNCSKHNLFMQNIYTFWFFLLIIPTDKKKKTEFSELIVLGRPSSGCLGHNGTSHLFFLWW